MSENPILSCSWPVGGFSSGRPVLVTLAHKILAMISDHPLQHFNVPSIKSRLMQHDLMFLYGVFHGHIDCPQLLHQFQLSTPVRRNRSPALWHVPFARVATIKNNTFCRIPSRCNELLRDNTSLDFFYSPISVYKVSVRLHAARAGFYWAFVRPKGCVYLYRFILYLSMTSPVTGFYLYLLVMSK